MDMKGLRRVAERDGEKREDEKDEKNFKKIEEGN
jgi:hypothetical protein